MVLEKYELAKINGGFSASLLNAIARLSKTIYDIGYSFGSSIRRLIKGKMCKV